MATSSPYFLSFSVCLLVFFCGTLAQFDQGQGRSRPWQSQPGFEGARGCRLERLSTLEFVQRMQSEAGYTEYLQESNEQLQCAGMSAARYVIEPQGLSLPSYSNTPRLVYIVRGRGLSGTIFPGCPETYQSFQHPLERQMEEGESLREKFRDEHQKVHRFREGDIIPLPAGVAHWCYNDGDSQVVAVVVYDMSNNANQLDARHREFLLAGRHQRGQKYQLEGQSESEEYWRSPMGMNIFSGFDAQMLSEALGVSTEMVRRLQGQNEQRGSIVRVRRGMQMMRPGKMMQEGEAQQNDEDPEEEQQPASNGLDETICNMKTRANIKNPAFADIYNPHAGRITYLNGQKLPILNIVQMSANRVVLYSNASMSPYWNINAHALMYVTSREAGRVQIVDNRGRTAFDGELCQGQMLLIPQHYAVMKRAERGRFSWVSFYTNSNSMVSQMAGKASIFRAMPVDVLTNAYHLSREEARSLKFNRGNEMSIFAPRFGRS